MGFSKESLIKSIRNNKHNHLSATYYLLQKKLLMKQNRPYSEAFYIKQDKVYNRAKQCKF